MARIILLSAILIAMTGCATTLYGTPHVPNGPEGCKAKYGSWGMELSGLVAMGDYCDGRIFHLPSTQQKSAGVEAAAAGTSMAAVWSATQESQGAATRASANQR